MLKKEWLKKKLKDSPLKRPKKLQDNLNKKLPQRNHAYFLELKLKVEAILFAADTPLPAGEIRTFVGEVSLSDIRQALRALEHDYAERAFVLLETSQGFQIRTRDIYTPLIKKQYGGKARSLSKNAMETLAVIAYKQPITKAQINALRQLDSSSILQTLKDKELIYVSGTRKEVGNPMEYRTTDKFLEVFGLKRIGDLPNLRSLQLNLDETKQISEALKTIDQTEDSQEKLTAKEIGYLEAE